MELKGGRMEVTYATGEKERDPEEGKVSTEDSEVKVSTEV